MNDKKSEAVENKEDKKTDTKLPKKKKEIGINNFFLLMRFIPIISKTNIYK